jgi:hypothetical protein
MLICLFQVLINIYPVVQNNQGSRQTVAIVVDGSISTSGEGTFFQLLLSEAIYGKS